MPVKMPSADEQEKKLQDIKNRKTSGENIHPLRHSAKIKIEANCDKIFAALKIGIN